VPLVPLDPRSLRRHLVILILIVVNLPDACALLTARRQDQRPRRLLHRPGRSQVLGQDQVYRG
jgi:hypothetical protein